MNELVGMVEIAELTGLKLESVHRYHSTGRMPPAATRISGKDLWDRATILEWEMTRVTRPSIRKG